MLGTGWLTLRQVKAALQNGRLEEAQSLLGQPSVRGHRKSWELLAKLTTGYVERAERHLKHGNPTAAWDDLARAEGLAPTDPAAVRLRQSLTRQACTDLRALLEAGEPQRALEAVALMGQHNVPAAEFQALEDAVKDFILARDLADRGEFAVAVQMFARVRRAVAAGAGLERFQRDLDDRQAKFQAALPDLHDAVDQRRWRDVLALADRVLAIAPQHGEARKARGRAWKSQEPETIAQPRGSSSIDSTLPDEPVGPPKRFLLWIDGVGGYLVCLGNRISFGAIAEGNVDVPLLADVSRMHATLGRDGEGYVIESTRPLQVNGRPTEKAALVPGDRVTLGSACQFLFQVPVPVSTTARLELVSGHRLPLSVDGILLMAETLLMGDGPQSHIVVPGLEANIVLYRTKDGVGVRYPGEFRVNGEPRTDRDALPPHAAVSGKAISFALEPAVRWGK